MFVKGLDGSAFAAYRTVTLPTPGGATMTASVRETIQVGPAGDPLPGRRPGVGRIGGGVRVRRAGGLQAPGAHSHDGYEETIYGVDGVLTWTVEGVETDVGPGDALLIPRGAVHRFDNTRDVDATALAIITPGILGPGLLPRDRGRHRRRGRRPARPGRLAAVMRRHGLTPAPLTEDRAAPPTGVRIGAWARWPGGTPGRASRTCASRARRAAVAREASRDRVRRDVGLPLVLPVNARRRTAGPSRPTCNAGALVTSGGDAVRVTPRSVSGFRSDDRQRRSRALGRIEDVLQLAAFLGEREPTSACGRGRSRRADSAGAAPRPPGFPSDELDAQRAVEALQRLELTPGAALAGRGSERCRSAATGDRW